MSDVLTAPDTHTTLKRVILGTAAFLTALNKAGLTEIALAVAATRVFPTVKRAMDYGEACLRVTIARETTSTVKATSPRPRLTAQPVN